ncbi:MAG TPA: gluconokinase [Ktedonobacterales bacterium]|nr:gluconokinase [Ktedonobacterales bacterium]
MDHRCTIGMDLGTTSLKAVAFDPDGRELARANREVARASSEEGAAEQDPQTVAQAATDALAEVVANVRTQGYVIGSVGLSAAMHSQIPVAADDSPLGPALLWMDTRPEAEAESLWRTPEGRAAYERTGTPVSAMAPLAKLCWLRTARPRLYQQAARFVSLKEWLWHYWFGIWEVDTSIASATGLYNLRDQAWDAGALALAGIAATKLSQLVDPTFSRKANESAVLRAAGLADDVAIVIGASDGPLANLGVGAVDATQMVLTIGTSCAVRMGCDRPLTDVASRIFCYVLADKRFIVGAPGNSGGAILAWLARALFAGQPPVSAQHSHTQNAKVLTTLLDQAATARDEHLLFLPYVAGERAPLWRADASGSVVGLRLEHTAAHVLRAATEGILFNMRWMSERPFELLGRPTELIATGKVLEVDWIRQLAADIFGLPVRFPGGADASATGAATLANIVTGQWSWDDAIQRHRARSAGVTRPSAECGAYQAKYRDYRQLARVLLPAADDDAPSATR